MALPLTVHTSLTWLVLFDRHCTLLEWKDQACLDGSVLPLSHLRSETSVISKQCTSSRTSIEHALSNLLICNLAISLHPQPEQKANPRQRSHVHNPNIPPSHRIPRPNIPVDLHPKPPHTPQVSDVCHEQQPKQHAPHLQVDDVPLHLEDVVPCRRVVAHLCGGAQHQRFIEGE